MGLTSSSWLEGHPRGNSLRPVDHDWIHRMLLFRQTLLV